LAGEKRNCVKTNDSHRFNPCQEIFFKTVSIHRRSSVHIDFDVPQHGMATLDLRDETAFCLDRPDCVTREKGQCMISCEEFDKSKYGQ
jgi:hypothetical protein